MFVHNVHNVALQRVCSAFIAHTPTETIAVTHPIFISFFRNTHPIILCNAIVNSQGMFYSNVCAFATMANNNFILQLFHEEKEQTSSGNNSNEKCITHWNLIWKEMPEKEKNLNQIHFVEQCRCHGQSDGQAGGLHIKIINCECIMSVFCSCIFRLIHFPMEWRCSNDKLHIKRMCGCACVWLLFKIQSNKRSSVLLLFSFKCKHPNGNSLFSLELSLPPSMNINNALRTLHFQTQLFCFFKNFEAFSRARAINRSFIHSLFSWWCVAGAIVAVVALLLLLLFFICCFDCFRFIFFIFRLYRQRIDGTQTHTHLFEVFLFFILFIRCITPRLLRIVWNAFMFTGAWKQSQQRQYQQIETNKIFDSKTMNMFWIEAIFQNTFSTYM